MIKKQNKKNITSQKKIKPYRVKPDKSRRHICHDTGNTSEIETNKETIRRDNTSSGSRLYSDCNQKQCGHYKTGTCKKCESCGARPGQVDNKCQTCFDCEYKPGCVRWDNKDQDNTNEEKMSNEEAQLTQEMEKQIRKVFLEAIKNKFGKQMAKEVDEKIEKELLKEKKKIVTTNSGDHECEECSDCSKDQQDDLMIKLKKMLENKKNNISDKNSNKQIEVKRYKNYIG